MVFDSNSLRSRLAAANGTADSITATALWILFHKRHAEEVAKVWAQTLEAGDNKLAQIYIANEVVQQSKLKRKGEFVGAFGAELPAALAAAYGSSDGHTRERIARVVKVWRDRSIFTPEVQLQIEEALQSGGSTSGGAGAPRELLPVISEYRKLQQAVKNNDREGIIAAKESTERVIENLLNDVRNVGVPVEEEVYTASDALQSQFQDSGDDGYAAEVSESEAAEPTAAEPIAEPTTEPTTAEPAHNSEGTEPAAKKPKVDIDPSLASFLDSLSKS